ncbi:MAG TPA: cytochrome c [Verrucomicrobiae bacterium]|nr:cytochrome c [Verrucomicrobiae bacterium]
MTDANPSIPLNPVSAEPKAARRSVPVWLLILFFLLLYWAMVYFDQRSGWGDPHVYIPYHSVDQLVQYQPPAPGANVLGKQFFDNVCALCHNTDGTGKPGQAPPLVGSEFALGTPNRMVRIPLVGLSGPVQVKGQQWNLSMPAMGAAMTDEQLAAVLTYIRQSWGNKASEITPAQVKAIRAQLGNRAQPFSAAELNAIQ